MKLQITYVNVLLNNGERAWVAKTRLEGASRDIEVVNGNWRVAKRILVQKVKEKLDDMKCPIIETIKL